MSDVDRLEKVAVLGAAGKMGSGITLLTALEMADLSLDPANAGRKFALTAIDISAQALADLRKYLRAQVLRAAEKKTVRLRSLYMNRADLVENEEVINQYIEDVLDLVHPATDIAAAAECGVVFEAATENLDLKIKLLSGIKDRNTREAWFLTNTSSIPISELDAKAGLGGRIIGFHFYNPPAVQKLVEVIRADSTLPELADFAGRFAARLRKTVVPSRDVAGFIGNGHFMRDALHALSETDRLAEGHGFTAAVAIIDKVSRDFLIRPMGIFQLIDYVGVDVCQCILRVMDERLPGQGLHSPLLDQMMEIGVKGGQFADGSQKDGFLKYEKGRPAGVFDPQAKTYVSLSEIAGTVDEKLGPLPGKAKPWKAAMQLPDRPGFLEGFFRELRTMKTPGAGIAISYGRKSREIGQGLVDDGVAANAEDVNTVLLTGFYHAYGPINPYFD